MSYGGFERDRNTLKFRCPARAMGAECKGMQQCPVGSAVRIPLSEDRRVFHSRGALQLCLEGALRQA